MSEESSGGFSRVVSNVNSFHNSEVDKSEGHEPAQTPKARVGGTQSQGIKVHYDTSDDERGSADGGQANSSESPQNRRIRPSKNSLPRPHFDVLATNFADKVVNEQTKLQADQRDQRLPKSDEHRAFTDSDSESFENVKHSRMTRNRNR